MIEHNKALGPLLTIATPAQASAFCRPSSLATLTRALVWARERELPVLVLGGGSNTLFAADYPGLVVQPAFAGLRLEKRNDEYVRLVAGAGVSWQKVVDFSLEHHLWGLENLTQIPGSAGAAPIQNIGAYGVELAQVFHQLRAYDRVTGKVEVFNCERCAFGYRRSYFKDVERDRFIVLEIELKLSHRVQPVLNYQGLETLHEVSGLTPLQVAARVAELRAQKLPDPAELPNSGSFFHNPVVPRAKAQALKARYPELVSYPQPDGREKIAAGWLIERAGFKGLRADGVGVHDRQALVLVNPGRAAGEKVLSLAASIQTRVRELFDLELVIEPRIYP